MDKKQILADLDRLRREVTRPEPNLKDVMAKLEEIERRISSIEARPYYVPAPSYPVYPRAPYYSWTTSGTSAISPLSYDPNGEGDAGMVVA